ncbi:PIN domain-containing protein [Gordonia pseudamarae]|jgi:predicted nucleic acid-binding protein|uniref:PIN domain-containing protein n=1 Tax=Gordonia pseudamarae TaxID=2831662 RepID=A0ABX6IC70_9ACTN|nr:MULTISPECIES: type II toxin-antitoxin system VapC family toxin [Gordonia]MBD0024365.1 type II toxin-antitoxin system VapC family toxin [Gordonia sp. (in: high G+C Gram-positive bacteria)]QHN24659.1 PIN domain-containing protein [Gordonia pseudamarae]QHN33589.1 PIN domain-containing protein [Gordonia pseudamarae]
MIRTHLRGLIDTNIIIHLERLPKDSLPGEVLISTVTLAELSAGIHQTEDPLERALRVARLQRTEAMFDPLPFDAEAARRYGLIAAGVVAVGRKPRRRSADLMIASVASARRLPLFTTNPDDFIGTEGAVTVVPVSRPDEA